VAGSAYGEVLTDIGVTGRYVAISGAKRWRAAQLPALGADRHMGRLARSSGAGAMCHDPASW
jgi:hypothetical protein